MVDLTHIQTARERIGRFARITPLLPTGLRCGEAEVLLKAESLQYTGSFKIRGAANCLAQLSAEERARGVIAASAGNHAQGVAAAAATLGLAATIVMPLPTPLVKVERTRRYGATVVLEGEDFEAALAHARRLQEQSGLVFIHPFADERIIAGQGAVGLEILEQAPEVDSIIVPVGGGGLISGIAVAVKTIKPEVKIFGVQSETMPAMARSLAAGSLQQVSPHPTIAEGIAVAAPAALTFDLIKCHVDDIITVSEAEIATAMLELLEDHKLVVEGAGATSYAALEKLCLHLGHRVVLVLSGGNADVTALGAVIDRGLALTGRSVRLTVDLQDVPGALARLSGILGAARANILEIYHNRTTGNVEIGRAEVEVVIGTRGPEHVEEVLHLLRMKGYDARRRD